MNNALIELLQEARKRKGWTIKDLADELGMNESIITSLEDETEETFDVILLYKVTEILELNFFKVIIACIPELGVEYKREVEILERFHFMTERECDIIMEIARALSVYYNYMNS